MSYDVRFIVKVEDADDYVHVGNIDANITWNVKRLILESSGWDIKNEQRNGLMSELENKITNGLFELTKNPIKYKQFESPNGWGTIEGVKEFYNDILFAWRELKREHPGIAKVAQVYVC